MRLSTAIPLLALMEEVRLPLLNVELRQLLVTQLSGAEGKQAYQKPQWYKTSDS
jgi:hypothetical protein